MKKAFIIGVALTSLMAVSACTRTQETAAIGAGAGAVIGGVTTGSVQGAVVGGVVGGVAGAQYGAKAGQKLRGEQLRALLAILVLAVALRLGFDLFVRPSSLFSLAGADS